MTQGRDDPSAGTHSDPQHGVHVGWAGSPGAAWSGRIAWNGARDMCLVFAGEASLQDGDVEDSTVAPPPRGEGRMLSVSSRLTNALARRFSTA